MEGVFGLLLLGSDERRERRLYHSEVAVNVH